MKELKRTWAAALSVRPDIADERLDALVNAGVRQFEVCDGQLEPWSVKYDYIHKAREISARFAAHGAETGSIHLPFAPFERIDPASFDAEARRYTVGVQSELIKAAADAGIKIAVIHPSGEPYPENERGERIKCAIETISVLSEVAVSCGSVIALENIPRTCLCRDSAEMKQFLEAIPALRVCFDTNHSLTEKNEDYIRAVGEKIITLHVSDYDFIDERHVLPTKGKIDWKSLVETLDEVGYSGRLLYETNDFASAEELWANYEYLMGL